MFRSRVSKFVAREPASSRTANLNRGLAVGYNLKLTDMQAAESLSVIGLSSRSDVGGATCCPRHRVLRRFRNRAYKGPSSPICLRATSTKTPTRWLTLLRKAMEQNYGRLDMVLADIEPEKQGEKR